MTLELKESQLRFKREAIEALKAEQERMLASQVKNIAADKPYLASDEVKEDDQLTDKNSS
jgi:hypothetical protein